METKISENGTVIFGRTGLTVKEDHLWRWTTLTIKFPPVTNRSIYVWTKISGKFDIMESTSGFHLLSRLSEQTPLTRTVSHAEGSERG